MLHHVVCACMLVRATSQDVEQYLVYGHSMARYDLRAACTDAHTQTHRKTHKHTDARLQVHSYCEMLCLLRMLA